MNFPRHRYRTFALLTLLAGLLAAVPVVVAATCAATPCCSDCNDEPIPSENGHGEDGDCCPDCPCGILCFSPACPACGDGALLAVIPLSPAHLFSPDSNPSDFIFEEPQPPRFLG